MTPFALESSHDYGKFHQNLVWKHESNKHTQFQAWPTYPYGTIYFHACSSFQYSDGWCSDGWTLFGSFEGRTCKKRKEEVERMKSFGRWGPLGFSFLHNIKSSQFGGLKNCIVRGVWRVWVNFSNSIYVVIILSKLKIH